MNFNRVNPADAPATLRAEALVEHFDATMPGWEVSEGYGDRFLSERDMPVYDASEDMERVPNEDWEAFLGFNN